MNDNDNNNSNKADKDNLTSDIERKVISAEPNKKSLYQILK